jgi:nucleoside-diphosphate-sugar epimerase
MKNKNVLITGGSGYFGEILCKKLINKNYNCTILDINPPDYNFLGNNVNYINCDIRDTTLVMSSLKNINYVFHNVAQVPLSKNKKLFHDVNYLGTKNILEASLENSIDHFAYTSSSAIFGVPDKNPINETTIPIPGEEYGKAKLDGEKIVEQFSKLGLKTSIIRPRTILGGGRLGIFQILFEWIYQNQNIPVFDNGNNIYQFVHADDLAEAIIKTTKISKSEIFNIGAEKYCSMRETLQYLIDSVNSKSKIKSFNSKHIIPFMNLASKLGISPLAGYHSLMYGKSLYFDIQKSQNDLDWTPKYSNKEMIVESYNYYIKNRERILNGNLNLSHHKTGVKQGILKLINFFI